LSLPLSLSVSVSLSLSVSVSPSPSPHSVTDVDGGLCSVAADALEAQMEEAMAAENYELCGAAGGGRAATLLRRAPSLAGILRTKRERGERG
jgi:hypothetical protein